MSTNLENLTLSSVMKSISAITPGLILISALGTFGVLGYFQADYYHRILSDSYGSSALMGVVIASIIELVRFVLLLSSMRDFEAKKTLSGVLGLIASIGLVVHDWSICNELGEVLGLNVFFLNFLVVLGLILEFRLILTVDSKKTPAGGKKQYSSNGVHSDQLHPYTN